MKRLYFVCTAFVSLILTAGAQAETLVLGSVNDDVRKHIERFTPLANYLETHLADHGITDVEISVLPNSAAMINAMASGEVDLYFDSPLVARFVARQSGAQPILRRWKGGVGVYHSVIIVPMDSAITSLDDLAGRTIGFQEPDSTSGFMLPAAMIQQNALTLEPLAQAGDAPRPGRVGYVFTGDDRNTVLWLARGLIDAAATDPQGLAWLEEAQPGAFRVLSQSIEVPRQVVVRRADMDQALTDAISAVLLDMTNTQEGRATMASFNDTTLFDAFPGGVDATFEPIDQVLDALGLMGLI